MSVFMEHDGTLVSDRTRHSARRIGRIRRRWQLSYLPERAVSQEKAIAGLKMAEMVAVWGDRLWSNPRGPFVRSTDAWAQLDVQAAELDLDALDAVIRIEQATRPAVRFRR